MIVRYKSLQHDYLSTNVLCELVRDVPLLHVVRQEMLHNVLSPPIVRREIMQDVLLPLIVRRELIRNVLLPPILHRELLHADTLAVGGPFALFCLAS